MHMHVHVHKANFACAVCGAARLERIAQYVVLVLGLLEQDLRRDGTRWVMHTSMARRPGTEVSA